MTDWQSLLSEELGSLDLSLPGDRGAQLRIYLELLETWSRSVNLTSLGPRQRVRRLVAEPIWAAERLQASGRYLDVGSGNGSPAVAWCIARDFSRADLVESRERRAVFLDVVARRAGIRRAHVHQGRFDDVRQTLAPPDWATLQGVRLDAGLLQKLRQLNPLVRVVWLTRGREVPESPTLRIPVPGGGREILVFERRRGTFPGREPSEDSGVAGR